LFGFWNFDHWKLLGICNFNNSMNLLQNKSLHSVLLAVLLALCLLSAAGPAAADDPDGYLSVTGPCGLSLPKDHGAHPGYRTEWWYYTGNVKSEKGLRFGFQLTFFRSQITPPGEEKKWPRPSSRWRTRQVYMAHAAVSDIQGKRHVQERNAARGALGFAGVSQSDSSTLVFLSRWSARIGPSSHCLDVKAGGFEYKLTLKPMKPPVFHGRSGYSLKGSTPSRASCYYSYTRMRAAGSVSAGNRSVRVNGSAWMDHEFSTAPLEPGIAGWDWFGLQLSDQTELMIYLLRGKNGTIHPVSSGTLVHADGRADHLGKEDFRVSVLDTWKSPRSKGRYPARWKLRIAPVPIDITVIPALSDQEMDDPPNREGITYWEGSVTVTGTKEDRPVEGCGYVELTGYARSFDAPM
jgi:predicted secreted hydrolase